jgi:hypothetical protein
MISGTIPRLFEGELILRGFIKRRDHGKGLALIFECNELLRIDIDSLSLDYIIGIGVEGIQMK